MLYLKIDERNRPAFEARGLAPFSYERSGQRRSMKYFEIPPEALEDQALLIDWVHGAIDAGLKTRTMT